MSLAAQQQIITQSVKQNTTCEILAIPGLGLSNHVFQTGGDKGKYLPLYVFHMPCPDHLLTKAMGKAVRHLTR